MLAVGFILNLAVKIVEDNEMVDRIQFHSYSSSPELARRVKRINPNLKVGLDCIEGYMHAPLKAIESFPWVDFIWIHEDGEPFWIDKGLISEIHKRGKKVYVLKPNLSSRWEQLIDMGIDGINCHSPLETKKYCARRGKLWLR